MKRFHDLDIIIPISLDLDWPEREGIIAEILEQHDHYGFTRFALACPCGGWRSLGYPPTSFFAERAAWFAEIRDALRPHAIECGWWITTTVKSGVDDAFTTVIRADGTPHPFANCALDPSFRRRFANDVALFAKIARPSFIITEDDYSVHAASPTFGCFCKGHIAEFSRREGKPYTREELLELFRSQTPEGYALLRRWRALAKDSLVGLSEEIRRAVDKQTPEIPIGYMQSNCCDLDGDCTEAVCRALAGPRHTPFSRLYGTFYGGVAPEDIPGRLFHALYSKQHIKGDFICYHESDTFPHTRFFTSGRDMLAIMGAAYSMGFDGSTFQTQQLVDHANEETAYGNIFRAERTRLNALHRAAKQCTLRGAELCYDPFWNNLYSRTDTPYWTQALSMFSLPWTATESDVTFLDQKQAEFADDSELRRYLAKKLLFLDGEAARLLTERGYGEYLGVEVGGPINDKPENDMLQWDLGAREVIREKFRQAGRGTNMPSAHMLARSKGKMYSMKPLTPDCEVITDFYSYAQKHITPAMTRFQNTLGGTVVTMAVTLEKNYSQSLYNYRRQRLFHRLITEHCDTLAFVREAPRVFTVMNEANEPAACGFTGMLTLINLSSDPLEAAALHLPPTWRESKSFRYLDIDGVWKPLPHTRTADGITLDRPLGFLEPLYLMLS